MRGILLLTMLSMAILARLSAEPAPAQISPPASQEGIRLLTLGTFHGDEAAVENGESWFALMHLPSGHALRSVKIIVETVNDPIVDRDDESTGKEITLDDSKPEEDCLFLIKGMSEMREREVPVLFEGRLFVDPGQTVRFGSHDRGITFRAESHTSPDGTVSYTVIARSKQATADGAFETREQTVYSLSGMHEGPPFDGSCGVVEWIGDLDGDGRWDLIVNLTDHYNVNEPTLFLSTLARDGELVGKAASLRTTGC